jgi:hypothetical protein
VSKRLMLFPPSGAHWSICCAILEPIGFWRGSQIDYFWNNSKTNEKKEVQETALKKHDFFVDFWNPVKIQWASKWCNKSSNRRQNVEQYYGGRFLGGSVFKPCFTKP